MANIDNSSPWQHRRSLFLILLPALLMFALVAPAIAARLPGGANDTGVGPDAKLTSIGEAFDINSGQLLYREYHFRQPGSALGSVEYRGPDRRLLGTKTLDFQAAPWAPAFQQVDLRTGEMVFAQWQGSSLTLGYRENRQGVTRRGPVSATAPVADAGFDNFIREHWSELLGNVEKSFQFAVPSRLDTITLVAKRRACDDAQARPAVVCFRVAPDNWLFALLVDPIDLQYDAKDQQLLVFQGLSNITDAAGGPQLVTIRYRHAEPGGYLADEQARQEPQRPTSS